MQTKFSEKLTFRTYVFVSGEKILAYVLNGRYPLKVYFIKISAFGGLQKRLTHFYVRPQ